METRLVFLKTSMVVVEPMRRCGLALGGLVLGLLVLEAVLQVAAWAVRVAPSLSGPPAGRRVLAVGDSNVFGLYVARSAAWPVQLSTRLGVEVVNAGVPGIDTARLRDLLPSLLAAYQPTDVIVLVGANDLWATGGQHWWRHSRVARLLALLAEAVTVDRPEDVDPERPRVLALGGDLVDVTARIRPATEPPPATRENLAAMLRLVRASGAQPWVLTYGSPTEPVYLGLSGILRAVAAAEGVPVIDGTVPAGMTFRDGHPTAEGYAVVAEKVAAALQH